MKILLTGKDGMVGWELARALPPLGEVIACGRKELDLADPARVVSVIREVKPDVVVNAAAYTAVDKAETERELAFQVNGTAPGIMAEEAKRLGALLVHYSTDYVFDGTKDGPYVETDAPNPLSVYGASKLAGERAIQEVGCRHLVLRTSWVYAARGRNFLLTILRLAKEKRELRVVDDQYGAPTWARDIARASAEILRRTDTPGGIYHLTAAGETTWCGFAREIVRLAGLKTVVEPITTEEYPTLARRPGNSRMEGGKLKRRLGPMLPPWAESARSCLGELSEVHTGLTA